MPPVEPLPVAAALCALAAGLQLVLARWRDLAPAAIAAGGAALLASDPEGRWLALGVAVLGAVGVARSTRAGVARPELSAPVGALAVAVAVASPWLGSPGLRLGVAAALATVGGVATALSVARLGARPTPVRWVGEIAVRGRGER